MFIVINHSVQILFAAPASTAAAACIHDATAQAAGLYPRRQRAPGPAATQVHCGDRPGPRL